MSTDSAAVHAGGPASRIDDPDLTDASAAEATVSGSAPTGHGRTAAASADTSPRASDAERADAVARLHEALGAGRLDLAETDERVASAYAALYRHELAALLADLPVDNMPFTGAPRWAVLWTLAVWRARNALTGTAGPRPTAAQQRTATLLIMVALVWMAACAILGALAVGP
jgi:hypothetical protein